MIMKINGYDTSLLEQELENFLNFIQEEEIDNDCTPNGQILINACSSSYIALQLIKEND